jgi:hypothetical protein
MTLMMIVYLRFILLTSLLIITNGTTYAQSKVPRFRDYPVNEAFIGKNAPLILKRDDMMFRTRLREAATRRPNFAGHYILVAWGCGAQCLLGAAIDAKTGKVFWLPHTTCCWGANVDDRFEPIEFRGNSRLIVFSGLRNEKEGDSGAHFYSFENGRFVHITSVLKGNQNSP